MAHRQFSVSKPDIVLFDFRGKTITVIEFSCPVEPKMDRKEVKKREKYYDQDVKLCSRTKT
jgi:hypothetical protein